MRGRSGAGRTAMLVWVRTEVKGTRNVGMSWRAVNWWESASWSKTLLSLGWTMKRTQRRSEGMYLEGPYPMWAVEIPREREAMDGFSGREERVRGGSVAG